MVLISVRVIDKDSGFLNVEFFTSFKDLYTYLRKITNNPVTLNPVINILLTSCLESEELANDVIASMHKCNVKFKKHYKCICINDQGSIKEVEKRVRCVEEILENIGRFGIMKR